ncbi:MAG: GIY-YIG nuclease family protein [Planctomycetota bacterium]
MCGQPTRPGRNRLPAPKPCPPDAALRRLTRLPIHDRLRRHNAGDLPSTARYRPWRLRAAFWFADIDKAAAFERYLKTGSGRAFAKRHF